MEASVQLGDRMHDRVPEGISQARVMQCSATARGRRCSSPVLEMRVKSAREDEEADVMLVASSVAKGVQGREDSSHTSECSVLKCL